MCLSQYQVLSIKIIQLCVVKCPKSSPQLLTSPLDDDPQQRIGGRQRFVEVVIIVDGKQVSMDVSVAQ